VVVGEGATRGAHALADHFTAHATALPFELRVARLGHIQRAGSPNVYDRTLATRFEIAAIEQLAAENYGRLIGIRDGAIKTTPLS
jgi:6-phosphofructokinase 1